ncbi:MAG TPA: hypothetical protein VLA71_12900, partial [Algoriphagus sp.]|nr:hypothetical protein [Algoriphagus sp.]
MKKLYKKFQKGLLLLICLATSFSGFAQEQEDPCNSSSKYLYWTGEENEDFFNENNWRETNQQPTPSGQASESNPVCLP